VVLSVGKVGPANAGYYQSTVVQGAEDYYAGDGDAPGRWVGRADLVGAVAGSVATAVEAGLLLEAKCAPDGSRLGKAVVTGRSVTAFDLTFSAPKSVSVLYALGDARVVAAVEAAHTAAVLQSVASLSPRIAYTRTGHAGAAVVDAEGVLGIRCRHRTSRALDPQLHDHVLIANAVRSRICGCGRVSCERDDRAVLTIRDSIWSWPDEKFLSNSTTTWSHGSMSSLRNSGRTGPSCSAGAPPQ
jgi:conjugative relaxase-like TrwC/TraI family protein